MPDMPFRFHWWVDETVPAIEIALVDKDGNYQYMAEIKLTSQKSKDPKDPF